MKSLLLFWVMALLLPGCQHVQSKGQGVEGFGETDEANAQRSREILYATLWMQHSTEYQAAALQAFESARSQLKTATKCGSAEAGQLRQSKGTCGTKSPWAKRPAAIVFDLDETLLDNSAYQAFRVKQRELHDDERWDTWVKSEEALEIAGALDFVKSASKAARIYYVSNRACRQPIYKASTEQQLRNQCPQLLYTMERMQKLGFPKSNDQSSFYLKGMYAGLESKEDIRRKIAADHRISMLVGDDLEDFVQSRAAYAENEAMLSRLWGKRWFIIPNPAYGSWPGVLSADMEQEVTKACDPLEPVEKDRCAYRLQYQARMAKLKTWLPLE